MDLDALPRVYFGFPGPLRDRLVSAILTGAKTSTSSLLVEWEREGEPLPELGQRSVVVDSDDRPVAVIETTEAKVIRVGDVDTQHAIDEGEDYTTVEGWRRAHEDFWHSPEALADLGDPGFRVDDDTEMVAERFRLVADLSDPQWAVTG